MPVYETLFDTNTKRVTRDSEITDYHSLDEAEMMHGDALFKRGSYQIHHGGVLFSVFPWSLPSTALASPYASHGG